MANPKYPHVSVELVGLDGNAFSILGRTRAALRAGGVSEQEIDAFVKEATSAGYDNLLVTVVGWVTVASPTLGPCSGEEDEEDEVAEADYHDEDEEEEDAARCICCREDLTGPFCVWCGTPAEGGEA